MKKQLKVTHYDSADYLETDEDIAEYLDAVMNEDSSDPTYLLHAIDVIARAKNKSQLARKAGISREGLYKALSEDGNPSFATVLKIIAALGLSIRFHPVKKGRQTSK